MKDQKTIASIFRLGKWLLVVHTAVICAVLVLSVVLIVHQAATGRPRLQIPEPADTILVAVVFVPFVTVALLDGLLSLFVERLGVQVHHAGLARRVLTLFSIFLPFWGIRFYEKFRVRTLQVLSMGTN